MENKDTSTRRDRNREAVQKYRNKVKTEDEELKELYADNEKKIAKLEKMQESLKAELKDKKNGSSSKNGGSSSKK